MEITKLQAVLKDAGVVGAGGAGFPTYAKVDKRAKTIILNCVECEPLLKLHRQLLEQYAAEIVQTFHTLGKAVGATDIVIGIKKSYKRTIAALNQYIGEYPEVRLGLLDEVYPGGDEVVLIYEVTGKVIRPGGLPIESGVAVFNVETIYNLYRAMQQDTPNVDKLVTVVGEVNNPITVRVPIGCTMEEVVNLAGGASIEDPVYFVGGPMMGNIGNHFDTVTKTTNAILVLPENHVIIQRKKGNAVIELKRAAASCCQCSMCTDLCPRHQLGHPIEPNLFMQAATCKDIQNPDIFLNTMFCSSCGLCEMYSCMQGLSPRTLIGEYKNGLRKAGMKPPSEPKVRPVEQSRKYRKAPMSRLMARLDLTKYNTNAPLNNDVVPMNKVKIMLSQHIGAPAISSVKKGDIVKVGQVVGKPAQGLSSTIHASIDGKVMEVTDKYITIQK